VRFSVYVSPEVLVEIERESQQRGISKNWLVNEVLQREFHFPGSGERDPGKILASVTREIAILKKIIEGR